MGQGYDVDASDAERGEVIAAVVAFVERHWAEARERPAVSPPMTDALTRDLLAGPTEEGADIGGLLAQVDRALDTGFEMIGPSFLSYIPSGGLWSSALGTLIGAATNQYTGASHAAPGSVAMEQSVVRWMLDLFGLPPGSVGTLLSGGSVSNLTAVVAARHRLGEDFHDGVIYASALAHHSIAKAARIAGIADRRVRTIAVDATWRLDVDALRDAVAADTAAGLRPMMIVGTAGTTDLGTVDPMHACADVAQESGAWFHVDGAYGGFFQLTERGREAFAGIERADSITADAHKSLLMPWGIGCLFVRDGAALVEANEGHGTYMRDLPDLEVPHLFTYGPELTRPNRGIAAWLPLHLHGVARFRAELDRMLDLARDAAEVLGEIPGIAVVTPPTLSIVAFRATAGDAATTAILEHLNASGDIYVSSTRLDGNVVVRFAFLNHHTDQTTLRRAVELVRESVPAVK